jgi:hypothetical protein
VTRMWNGADSSPFTFGEHVKWWQMDIAVRFNDLPILHPELSWDHMSAAAVSIFLERGAATPFGFELTVQDVPGFDDDLLKMKIDPGRIADSHVARVRKTYDRTRLIEMAAIALAGLGLYYSGGHVIYEVALRGSAADYLVDEGNYLLEIGGRSRTSDFASAWRIKWQQLLHKAGGDFFLVVAEFEQFTGRLAFKD